MPHIVTGILLTLQSKFGGHLFFQTYITSEFQKMWITIWVTERLTLSKISGLRRLKVTHSIWQQRNSRLLIQFTTPSYDTEERCDFLRINSIMLQKMQTKSKILNLVVICLQNVFSLQLQFSSIWHFLGEPSRKFLSYFCHGCLFTELRQGYDSACSNQNHFETFKTRP